MAKTILRGIAPGEDVVKSEIVREFLNHILSVPVQDQVDAYKVWEMNLIKFYMNKPLEARTYSKLIFKSFSTLHIQICIRQQTQDWKLSSKQLSNLSIFRIMLIWEITREMFSGNNGGSCSHLAPNRYISAPHWLIWVPSQPSRS